jgi:Glycosyltransferase family 87
MSAALDRSRTLNTAAMLRAGGRVLAFGFLGLLPPLLLLVILIGSFHSGTGAWAIDFDGNFFKPAREIVRGLSPYHPDELVRVRHAVANGHRPDQYDNGVFAAYPAPALLLGVPFSFLPLALAEWLWAGCMLGAGWLALRIVGVRDWRVYGAALLTPAALSSVLLGAVDLGLVLGLAICWRWRNHAGRAGVALGAIIALKLLAAPLIAWLLVTRRFRAAAVACATSAVLVVGGWALIGFHGFTGYQHLLGILTDIESTRGYSAVAYANLIGISGSAASLAPYVVGAVALGALWMVSRRRAGGDEAAFLLGVLAVLAFSPIVWHHYLLLLFVPLAVYRPRFGPIWMLPLGCWVVWRGAFFYTGWAERLVFLAVIAGLTAWMLTRDRAPESDDVSPAGTLPAWR